MTLPSFEEKDRHGGPFLVSEHCQNKQKMEKTTKKPVEIPLFLDEERDNLDWPNDDEIASPVLVKKIAEIPKPAGFWIRLLAFEIDLFLLVIGGVGLSEIMHRLLMLLGQAHTIVPVSLVLWSFLTVFYFALFEGSSWKGTPGKRILGLRVTTTRGKRISRFNALTRTLTACVCATPFFAGFIAVLFTRKKQSWHDLAAKTLVLRKPGEVLLPDSLATWESGLIRIASVALLIPFAIAATSTSKTLISPVIADHQRKTRIETAIEAVKPIQEVIMAEVKTTKSYPKKIPSTIFEPAAANAKAIVVYNPSNGVLTMQLSDPRQSRMAVLSLYPFPGTNGGFKWNCSAFGIEDKVLPEDCKPNKK